MHQARSARRKLGSWRVRCALADRSASSAKERWRKIYGKDEIVERHRHRYEVNNSLLGRNLRKKVWLSPVAHPGPTAAEPVELPKSVHPWFVGCQFHPEFTSSPRNGHPLFTSFVRAVDCKGGK